MEMLVEMINGGGVAMRLLLIPAILGAVVLSAVQLFRRHKPPGVFQASVLVVLGAGAVAAAHTLWLSIGILAEQGARPETILGITKWVLGPLMVTLAGAVLLALLEGLSVVRYRGSGIRSERTLTCATRVTGWLASAIGVFVLFTVLVIFIDAVALENPAKKAWSLVLYTRVGLAFAVLTLLTGLASLAMAMRASAANEPAAD